MLRNDEVLIMVGEPWDFTSKDGDNRFIGKIINCIKESNEDRYLIEVNNPFILKNKMVNYVATQTRNTQYPENINMYYIPDELINNFSNLESIRDYLVFIAIGSFKN
jgi:hypothetical protein